MEDSQFTKLLAAVTSLQSRTAPAISSENVPGQMALATINDMCEFLTASIQTPLEDREAVGRLTQSFFAAQTRMTSNLAASGDNPFVQEVHGLWSKMREAFFLKFNSTPAPLPPSSPLATSGFLPTAPQDGNLVPPTVPIRGQPYQSAGSRRRSDQLMAQVAASYSRHPGPPANFIPDANQIATGVAPPNVSNAAEDEDVELVKPQSPQQQQTLTQAPPPLPYQQQQPPPHMAPPGAIGQPILLPPGVLPPGFVPVHGPPGHPQLFTAPGQLPCQPPMFHPMMLPQHPYPAAPMTASAQLRAATEAHTAFLGETPIEVPLRSPRPAAMTMPHLQAATSPRGGALQTKSDGPEEMAQTTVNLNNIDRNPADTPNRNLLGQRTVEPLSSRGVRPSQPMDVSFTPSQVRDHRPRCFMERVNDSQNQSGLPSLCLNDSRASSYLERSAAMTPLTSYTLPTNTTHVNSQRSLDMPSLPPQRTPTRAPLSPQVHVPPPAAPMTEPKGASPARLRGFSRMNSRRRSTSEPSQTPNPSVERIYDPGCGSAPGNAPPLAPPNRLPEPGRDHREAETIVKPRSSDTKRPPRDSLFDDEIMNKALRGTLREAPTQSRSTTQPPQRAPREGDLVTEDLGTALGSPEAQGMKSFDGISTVFTVSPGPNPADPSRLPSVAEADSCIDGILSNGFNRHRMSEDQRRDFDFDQQTPGAAKRISQVSCEGSLGGEEAGASPGLQTGSRKNSSSGGKLKVAPVSRASATKDRDLPRRPSQPSRKSVEQQRQHSPLPSDSLEISMSEVSQALGEEGVQHMEKIWGSNQQLAPPQPTRNSSSSPAAEPAVRNGNQKRRSSGNNKRAPDAPKPANTRRSGGGKKSNENKPPKKFGVRSVPKAKNRDMDSFFAKQAARRKQLEQFELTNAPEEQENVA